MFAKKPIYNGSIPLFNNLKFNYIKNNAIIIKNKIIKKESYKIYDNDLIKPLEIEESFKYNLEQSIKNYINDNLSKLPFESDKYTEIINFDYKIVSDRLNDIKSINSVEILSQRLNTSNLEKPTIELNINVMYEKQDGKLTLLLPKLKKPLSYDIVLNTVEN